MELTRIAKLNNCNYPAWSFSVQALLRREQIWKYVDPGVPPEPLTDAWKDGDERALATIQLMLDESQFGLIRGKTTAKATWTALKEQHNKTSLGQKVTLLKLITNQNFKEGENMETYLAEIEKHYSRLENSGFEMKECLKVALILRGLPDSFDPLTTALEARNEDELTLEMVKVKLIDLANKQRKQESVLDEQVLKMRSDQHTIVCYYCGKQGHRKRNCKAALAARNSSEKRENKKPKEKAKTVRENDQKESFTFMVRHGQSFSSAWVIDSGATSHLANNVGLFTRLDKSIRPVIATADGKALRTLGVGDCSIECINNAGKKVTITLTDVIYAPEIEGNLISVTKLAKKGVGMKFDADHCKLSFDGHTIASAHRVGGLYQLNLYTDKEQLLMVEQGRHNEDCQHMWHRRLGHRDPDVLGEIERKNLASGMKVRKCSILQTCECCVEGKMARPAFPTTAEKRSVDILDIVHSDVAGPMKMTPGGCRYYLTMIDDHSRYTMVYFLRKKSDAADKICEYVRLVQTQFGKTPKVIRSDRGGEYTTSILRKFYSEQGIKAEYTAGYAPQQNGVAERKNRSLSEMALCMLLDAGMPRKFWAEAVNTAAYIQNRLPTTAINSTPFEIWFKKKPDLKHMKVFGCSAFVWTPSQKRKKFDVKAVKMTFVGYSAESKAYRFLNVKTGQIVVSRDVKFMEMVNEKESSVGDASKKSEGKSRESGEVAVFSGTTVQSSSVTEQGSEDSQDEFYSEDENEELSENELIPDEVNEHLVAQDVRRSNRLNFGVAPQRLTIGIAATPSTDPRTVTEALNSADSDEWKAAMKEEMASLQENETWELTQLPHGKKAIGCKWVFKRKEDESGNVVRFKARLVAQGFSQKFGSDYDQVFAPVVRQTTFRTILILASHQRMQVKHVDIKTAYLYATLQEEIYMKQPPGYISKDQSAVCRLKRSLYGLKQAARVWNQWIDTVLRENGFERSSADSCLYVRRSKEFMVFVLIYVDDIVVVCKTDEEYQHFTNILRSKFKISELGNLKYFLGIHVRFDGEMYFLNQRSYIEKLLARFGLKQCKSSKVPMATGFLQQKEEDGEQFQNRELYQSLIGALLYISVNTRPDIAIATSILGRRVSKPTTADWLEAKKILRYLKGTVNHELHLGGRTKVKLECYVDADWAGEVEDRKSNTGFLFKFRGGLIGWTSRKQATVALSSTEAEYVALAECLQELQWLRKLMNDVGEIVDLPILINEDNQSCIALTIGDRTSRKSKHIDTKYCFVKDLVDTGVVTVQYCPTEHMEADLLTKPLGAVKLQQIRTLIGVKPADVEEEC